MIIISAAEFETTPIRKLANAKYHSFLSCGIGSLSALENSIYMQSKIINKDILFIGSCGVFGHFNKISLITSNEIYWLPSDQRTGHAWSIEQNIPKIKLAETNYVKLPKKTVITSPLISKDPNFDSALSLSFPNPENVVENLELYCFLKNTFSLAKSVTVILAITNNISSHARKQWKENYIEASELTAEYLSNHNILK